MSIAATVLEGTHVRLEPLEARHVASLLAAAATEQELRKWSASRRPARAWRSTSPRRRSAAEGTARDPATVRRQDGAVVGSTRFFLIERWSWPAGHPTQGAAARRLRDRPHLVRPAARSAPPANTEAKLLMLAHAFEAWEGAPGVLPHRRAQRALAQCAAAYGGAASRGILRAHRLAQRSRTARFGALRHHRQRMAGGEA